MSHAHKKDVGALCHKNGVSFRVWAPFAKYVQLTGNFNDWSTTDMESEGDGYWSVFVDNAEPGQEYRFIIDTGLSKLQKNDPRAYQLTTSDGNSVIVDLAYDWEGVTFTPPPFNQQIIYELHVGTFYRTDLATPGTFADVIDKLDYLSDLGINMIELMPVCSMYMDRGWGYAPDFLFAVESLYGGRHEMLRLVKEAHRRGIGVILDVVYNHLGPETSSGMWRFDGWSENDLGGIYYYNDYRAITPWGNSRPDYGRPEVRQFLLDNIQMWLHDFRLDGLRVDSTIYMRNADGKNDDPSRDIPEAWTMMQDITSLAHKLNPSAIMIAEDVAGNEFITKPKSEGGAGFSSQWKLSFAYFIHECMRQIHDSDRRVGQLADELVRLFNGDAFQGVIYSDSHDTAANGGARLNEEISPGHPTSIHARRRTLLASALLFTSPGIPMLFQGQEFMQGGSFNDWDAIDWENASKYDGILLAHKHLIDLRKNTHDISGGLQGNHTQILDVHEDNKVLAYHRWDGGGPGDDVVVIANFSNVVRRGYEVHFPEDGVWRERFNSSWIGYSEDFKNILNPEVAAHNGTVKVDLAPYSIMIFSKDRS